MLMASVDVCLEHGPCQVGKTVSETIVIMPWASQDGRHTYAHTLAHTNIGWNINVSGRDL